MKHVVLNRLSLVFLFQLLNYAFSFFFTPFLSRRLMYGEFATYSQVATIAEFANVLFGFGLTIIIYKILSDEKKDHPSVIRTCFQMAFILFLAVGTLAFCLQIPLAGIYNNPALAKAVQLSILYVGVGLPINILSSVLIFYSRLKPLYIVSTICNLGRFLVLYLATHVLNSFSFIFIGFTFLSLTNLIFYYLYARPFMRAGQFNWGLGKSLVREGWPLSVNSILGKCIFLTGGIIVSQLIDGTKDFAIYRNGAFEMPFIGTLYSSLSIIIFPEIARRVHAGSFRDIVTLKKKISLTTSLAVYPMYIFFCFFGGEFIRAYLSDKFSESALIFILFNSLLLIRINDYEDILINMGKSRINMYVYILGAAINIPLNYVLIRQYGSIGGAIATPITIFLMMGILLVTTCRLIGYRISDFFDFPKMLLIVIIAVVMALATRFLFEFFTISNVYLRIMCKGGIFFSLTALVFFKLKFIDEQLIAFIRSKLFFLNSSKGR